MPKGRGSDPNNLVLLPGTTLPDFKEPDGTFEPTPRMIAARAAVREMVDQGLAWPHQWIEEAKSATKKSKVEPVLTGDEWRDWDSIGQPFHDWWYDKLYPVPNAAVEGALFMAWQAGAVNALKKGDPRWLIYVREQMLSKPQEGTSALSEILGGRARNPWKEADEDPTEGAGGSE